jgi:phosphopantothenoylcysteine decarboxylase/phosphopantothenate--cysteine ligase
VARGRAKLHRKNVDFIVANDISRPDAGFEVDTNEATIISAEAAEPFTLGAKRALAAVILDRAESMLQREPSRR